jgi:phthiodiolone/phenolphthiodiolone dimycocerosates ketoreductase
MGQPGISTGVFLPWFPPMSDIRGFLRVARLAGFDSVFVADHLRQFNPTPLWDRQYTWLARRNPDPHAAFDFQTLLGHLARDAGGIRLGVGVTEPVRRHPVLIAQAMLTLAHMTKRPPILGIGLGERENIEPYGLNWAHPVDRLEEALQIIRQCFTSGQPIDFAGEHFQLRDAIMGLRPPPGRTPEIWVAAHGPRMLRLAGRYADGWFPVIPGSPQDYAAKLELIRSAAREAGRDPNTITPAFNPYIAVAPTERQVRAMLDKKAIRAAGLSLPADVWRAAGAEHPFGANFRGYVDLIPDKYDRQTWDNAIARVPNEMIDKALIYGTPEQVTRHLHAYADAGMRHAVLLLESAQVSRRHLLYGIHAMRKIARALRTTN